jgi:hypothetical protein
MLAANAEFAKTKKGLAAHKCSDPFLRLSLADNGISGLDAGIKLRFNPSELAELGPEFKKVWDSYFANAPDKPVLCIAILSA